MKTQRPHLLTIMTAAILIASSSRAQVPALLAVPEFLSDAVSQALVLRRTELKKQLGEMIRQNDEFEKKYGTVQDGSPDDAQAKRELERLERLKNDYVEAANRFNEEVLAAVADAKRAKPKSVKIGVAAQVRGTVEWVTSTGAVPVRANSPIFFDGHYRTGPGGRLQILLVDETVFTIGPESDLVLDEFVYDPHLDFGKIAVRVGKGIFRFVTGKVAKKNPDSMKVRLPVGTIGIRGTEGIIECDGKVTAQVTLLSGHIDFTPKDGSAALSIRAGERLVVTERNALVETADRAAAENAWRKKSGEQPADGVSTSAVLPEEAPVAALSGGQVREVLVKPGNVVKAGAVLARLDDDSLRAKLAVARAEYQRAQSLREQPAITVQDYQAAEIRHQMAADALAGATVKAPFAGEVAEVLCEAGEVIEASRRMFTLKPLPENRQRILRAREAFENGLMAAEQTAWELAIQYFSEAQQAMEREPSVLYALGLAHAEAGHAPVAAAWLRAYLGVAPRASNAETVRGEIARLEALVETQIGRIIATGLENSRTWQADERLGMVLGRILSAQIDAGFFLAARKNASEIAARHVPYPADLRDPLSHMVSCQAIYLAEMGRFDEAQKILDGLKDPLWKLRVANRMVRAKIEFGDSIGAGKTLAWEDAAIGDLEDDSYRIRQYLDLAESYAMNGQASEARRVLDAAERYAEERALGDGVRSLISERRGEDLGSKDQRTKGYPPDEATEWAYLAARILRWPITTNLPGELERALNRENPYDVVDQLAMNASCLAFSLNEIRALEMKQSLRSVASSGPSVEAASGSRKDMMIIGEEGTIRGPVDGKENAQGSDMQKRGLTQGKMPFTYSYRSGAFVRNMSGTVEDPKGLCDALALLKPPTGARGDYGLLGDDPLLGKENGYGLRQLGKLARKHLKFETLLVEQPDGWDKIGVSSGRFTDVDKLNDTTLGWAFFDLRPKFEADLKQFLKLDH